MRFPFEVRFEEIQSDPEPYVDAVFGSLQSEFMVMPRGKGREVQDLRSGL